MSRVLIGFIRFYQRFISPLKRPCCRFYPTCSEYTIEALKEYGLISGAFLALKRILKCHPFHPGGYDPLDTDWHPIPSPSRRTPKDKPTGQASLRGRSASYGAGGLKYTDGHG